ncbi:MAG: hypothetical protein ACTSUB_09400 [Candidatus Thorarchaeota archaeon]
MDSISNETERMIAQWELLKELGLQEFYGCDINILPILKSIPANSDSVDVKIFLQHRLVEMLLEKLDAGASTILLDTKKMKGKPAEVLIPRIDQMRRNEIQNIAVCLEASEILCYDVFMKEIERKLIPKRNQSINLENLWFTAYGYEVLSKHNIGLHTDLKGLKKIEQSLKRLDAPLNLDNYDNMRTIYQVEISSPMREYILSKIK